MSDGRAPSAPRTAISRERCETLYDSTPKRPTAAMISAKAANAPIRPAKSRTRQVPRQPLLHRRDVVERDTGVLGTGGGAQRGNERDGVAGSADDDDRLAGAQAAELGERG